MYLAISFMSVHPELISVCYTGTSFKVSPLFLCQLMKRLPPGVTCAGDGSGGGDGGSKNHHETFHLSCLHLRALLGTILTVSLPFDDRTLLLLPFHLPLSGPLSLAHISSSGQRSVNGRVCQFQSNQLVSM